MTTFVSVVEVPRPSCHCPAVSPVPGVVHVTSPVFWYVAAVEITVDPEVKKHCKPAVFSKKVPKTWIAKLLLSDCSTDGGDTDVTVGHVTEIIAEVGVVKYVGVESEDVSTHLRSVPPNQVQVGCVGALHREHLLKAEQL